MTMIAEQAGLLPIKSPPPSDEAAIFTAHRLDGMANWTAHAIERLEEARKAGPFKAAGQDHARHMLNHINEALEHGTQLAANLRKNYPAEGKELDKLIKVIGLSKSVYPAAKTATTAHLLDSILYNLGHSQRHAEAMLSDKTAAAWAFDAEHVLNHLEGTQEHIVKLRDHLKDNYPAEAGYLAELKKLELGWRYNPDEPRDRYGKWTKEGGESAPFTQGGLDYEMPDHQRLHSKVSPYPYPEDHPFFHQHPVSAANVKASFARARPEFVEQGLRWYADAHILAKNLGGGDADKGAGVIAAYSPQTSWPVNLLNASRALEMGRAIGHGDGGMITDDMMHHAQKVFDGTPADEANTSSKTHAFARLIRNGGDDPADKLGDVVIDRHAMSVAMQTRLPKSEADKAPIDKDRFYQYVADQYRQAAIEISRESGHPISPHQLQAITWLQQQSENDAIDDLATGKEAALVKGRRTMIGHAWQHWQDEAVAHHHPVHPGTTTLANGIAAQLIDLAFNPGEPRDSRGRWTRYRYGPGTIRGILGATDVHQGFSISPRTGHWPKHGYMVALDGHTHTYPQEVLDDPDRLRRAIDDLLVSEKEAFRDKNMYLGGWVEDGKLWLDPSENILDRDEAEKAGHDRDQVGIFDLDKVETVYTGGSGGGHITEHALSWQGVPEGARELLGLAGGRAAGGSQGAGGQAGRGIAAQLLELAGHPTLSKEQVNYRESDSGTRRCGTCDMFSNGTCTLVKGSIDPDDVCDRWEPEDSSVSLSWRDAWKHERRDRHGRWTKGAVEALLNEHYPAYFSDRINKYREDEPNSQARIALANAGFAVEQEHYHQAVTWLREAAKHSDMTGAEYYKDLADELETAATAEQANSEAVGALMSSTRDTVTHMFDQAAREDGYDRSSMDWNGKPPELYDDFTNPGTLAEIDWDGQMTMASTPAQHIRDAMEHPDQVIMDPAAFTVALHEAEHAVVPDGQKRAKNGDKKAYAEGSKEHRAVYQRIEEGFNELGTIQHAEEYFRAAGIADRMTLRSVMGSGGNYATMAEVARDINTPERIRLGYAWGHYPDQTRDAYNWVASLSIDMMGREDPDTIRRLTDQINAVGVKDKVDVMAKQAMAAVYVTRENTSPVLYAQVKEDAREMIMKSWADSEPPVVATLAKRTARKKAQALREKAAAKAAAKAALCGRSRPGPAKASALTGCWTGRTMTRHSVPPRPVTR